MSDKIKRVTPREIAEMLVNEQALADTRFVLAAEHDAEIERLRARAEVLERVRKAAVRMIRRMPKGCWCIREQEGLIDALAESRKQANIKAYL